jgi:NAD(P)-dependent dehydrogenase (short-subunit alcohol dehydrogenase family)
MTPSPPQAPDATIVQRPTFPDLAGRGIVVTGAAGGIGSAAARQFVAQGASVLCLDRDSAGLARLAQELGDRAPVMTADVTDPDDVAAAARTAVETFGDLTGWINNAGSYTEIPSIDLPLDEWRRILATNLDSAFLGSQAAGRVMIAARRGSIVNVSSNAGIRTSPRNLHYSVAKAGVAHLTRCLAAEWGKHGVRVNTVIPGYTDTPIIDWLTSDADKLARTERAIPLRRIGQPDDVAAAMVFLCSQSASYITGTTLCADGGLQIS